MLVHWEKCNLLILFSRARGDTYYCMLFNDEVHTYEQVIFTLQKAVNCTQKEAVSFATIVDRDVSSPAVSSTVPRFRLMVKHSLFLLLFIDYFCSLYSGQEVCSLWGLPVLWAGQICYCGESLTITNPIRLPQMCKAIGFFRALWNQFYFFPNSILFFSKFCYFLFKFFWIPFFSVLIFLDSFLMVKLNFIKGVVDWFFF